MMASIKEGVTDDGHTLPINLSPQKKRGLLENTDFVYKNMVLVRKCVGNLYKSVLSPL